MNINSRESKANKKILIVVGIVVFITIGLIGKNSNEEKRMIENSIKAIEDGDYEYARAALGSVVDGNSKKVDKMWNIVVCYQSANEQLYYYNNIEMAKEYLDKMNSDYKKYDKLKADVNKVEEEIKSRENYIKEFDVVLKEAEQLALSGKNRDTLNKARSMVSNLKYYFELPERQRQKVEEILGMVNKGFDIILNEEKAKEDDLRQENNENIVEHSYKNEYIDKLNLIEEGVSDLDYLYESGVTLDMNQAEMIQFERWDDILNEIYNLLKIQLSEVEMKELTNKQIKWIEDRDTTASNAANVFEGGSFATVEYNATLVRLTRERCYELVNTYMK